MMCACCLLFTRVRGGHVAAGSRRCEPFSNTNSSDEPRARRVPSLSVSVGLRPDGRRLSSRGGLGGGEEAKKTKFDPYSATEDAQRYASTALAAAPDTPSGTRGGI